MSRGPFPSRTSLSEIVLILFSVRNVNSSFGILIGGYAEPYLIFLAITLSLLVSYTRSRGESLGVKLQGIGIGERAERLLVIGILGIVGGFVSDIPFMEYAVIIVIIIAAITFIQRIIVVAKNLRE